MRHRRFGDEGTAVFQVTPGMVWVGWDDGGASEVLPEDIERLTGQEELIWDTIVTTVDLDLS